MTDNKFMEHALSAARKAGERDEVPIGAVIVHEYNKEIEPTNDGFQIIIGIGRVIHSESKYIYGGSGLNKLPQVG